METDAAHDPRLPDGPRSAWRQFGVVLALSALVWGLICLFQVAAELSDAQNRGQPATVFDTLRRAGPLYIFWPIFSTALFMALERRRARLTHPLTIATLLAISTVFYYLPFILYEQAVALVSAGAPWSEFWGRVARYPAMYWYIDATMFIGCFAAVYAAAAVRAHLDSQKRKQRVEAENLSLRLELEQQRLAALQAQLEPHFLFNALNAISALVRGDDKPTAISALVRLSELLRYALTASSRDWVRVGDELDFIRDYLTLQNLRHDGRLHVAIVGDTSQVREADCPPLILQPLVENALRHGLERQGPDCEISLTLAIEGERLVVELSNPVSGKAPANPGLGLGLPGVRSRLSLLYGPAAKLETGARDGRFTAILSLPRHAYD